MDNLEARLDDYRQAVVSGEPEREVVARTAVLTEVAEGQARRARQLVQRGIDIGRAELQKEFRALIGAQQEGG